MMWCGTALSPRCSTWSSAVAVAAPVGQPQAQSFIEPNGTGHIGCGERDSTDRLDVWHARIVSPRRSVHHPASSSSGAPRQIFGHIRRIEGHVSAPDGEAIAKLVLVQPDSRRYPDRVGRSPGNESTGTSVLS